MIWDSRNNFDFCRTLWRSDHEVRLSSPPPPPTHHPPTTLSSEIESVSLWQAHALKPIHFLKAHVNSYSSTAMEHKYKDKDNYKYKDKDKDEDTKTITGTLTVCYIFRILMTRQVQPSTAHFSLVPPSRVWYRPVQSSAAQYSLVPLTTV